MTTWWFRLGTRFGDWLDLYHIYAFWFSLGGLLMWILLHGNLQEMERDISAISSQAQQLVSRAEQLDDRASGFLTRMDKVERVMHTHHNLQAQRKADHKPLPESTVPTFTTQE